MPTEADTCRTLVLPKLYAAGWTDEQIAKQRTKHVTEAALAFTLPDVPNVRPLSHRGSMNETAGKFGRRDQCRHSVNQPQLLPHVA